MFSGNSYNISRSDPSIGEAVEVHAMPAPGPRAIGAVYPEIMAGLRDLIEAGHLSPLG